MGYHQAGFEVTGVDIRHQKRYPFKFIQANVLELDSEFFGGFDVITASPPCQKYSDLAKQAGGDYPDLIKEVRDLLRDTGKPYVIENVDTAPLEDPVMLCGAMFKGLRVYRHRKFESNLTLTVPQHPKHIAKVYTYDRRKHHFGQPLTSDTFVQVTGGGNAPVKVKGQAMGIDWMINKELNEAIPPAYAKYLGDQIWTMMTSRGS
jgi:DNA (cytosine-5)-methyltransferase 1